LRPSTSASIRHSNIVPRRPRTVGAVTRAITNYWVREEADSTADKLPSPAEKRPADQYEGNGEEKELHKKLRPLSSSAGINHFIISFALLFLLCFFFYYCYKMRQRHHCVKPKTYLHPAL
jgi:hypothetical protein